MRHPKHYRLLQTISLLHAHWEGGIVVPVTIDGPEWGTIEGPGLPEATVEGPERRGIEGPVLTGAPESRGRLRHRNRI